VLLSLATGQLARSRESRAAKKSHEFEDRAVPSSPHVAQHASVTSAADELAELAALKARRFVRRGSRTGTPILGRQLITNLLASRVQLADRLSPEIGPRSTGRGSAAPCTRSRCARRPRRRWRR
jgi:hypothetical protein